MKPADLLHLAPESFYSGERQMIARAFQRAWLVIAPEIGDDPAKIRSTRLWLAEAVIERACEHDTVDKLASAAIFAAVQEALHIKDTK